MAKVRKDLEQILLDEKLITPEKLEYARQMARSSRKKLVNVILQEKLVSPELLASAYSLQMGIPIADLSKVDIQPQAIALVPEHVAREHNLLPLYLDGDTLTVAMEDPEDIRAIDILGTLTRKRIEVVIAYSMSVTEAINSSYRLTTRIQQQADLFGKTGGAGARGGAKAPPKPEVVAPTEDTTSQAPIVQTVSMLLTQAVQDRGSDIHFEPQKDRLLVRYRIDGTLHEVVSLPMTAHQGILTRIKVMASMNIAERRRPQDGQFTYTVNGRQVDFRVATAESNYGEMAVLRVLDRSLALMQLNELGMRPELIESHKKLINAPFGMIMVSGPTGSGKTTSLYASVSMLDSKHSNIMTIEDPVEYRFDNINQIQVNRLADITFASGLRAIMRLDPDVILVGEIRDAETANTAVQAALTGHLVLTSVHANNAAGAITRLMDMGVEPYLITSAVIGSLSQRLVRKVCPHCKTLRPAPANEAILYEKSTGEKRTEFYYGQGCNYCSRTGFRGRSGIYELMTMSDELRRLIMKGASNATVQEQAVQEGMITLFDDGMLKAKEGVTTPGEVIRNAFSIG